MCSKLKGGSDRHGARYRGRRTRTGRLLLPTEAGRYLPLAPAMNAVERIRTSNNPPLKRARLPELRHDRVKVPDEGVAPPFPRCERGVLLLNQPGALRDSESHGACVLMRHARRLRLPSRIEASGGIRRRNIRVSKWTRWESNPQNPRSERGASANCATDPNRKFALSRVEGLPILRGPERPRDRRVHSAATVCLRTAQGRQVSDEFARPGEAPRPRAPYEPATVGLRAWRDRLSAPGRYRASFPGLRNRCSSAKAFKGSGPLGGGRGGFRVRYLNRYLYPYWGCPREESRLLPRVKNPVLISKAFGGGG